MVATIQDIKLFVAAYEEPTFAAAAARVGATQPGVSYHIRQLENMLDTKLFIREKQNNLPTPAADKYYRHCLEVLRAYEEAGAAMRIFKGTAGRRHRIGIIPSLTRRALSAPLKRFIDKNPNNSLHVVETTGPLLTSMVLIGDIDFAISSMIGDVAGVRTQHLFTSDIYMVSRAAAESSLPRPVQMSTLDPIKIVWWGRTNAFRQIVQTYCRHNDVQIDSTLEMDSLIASLDFVRQTEWKMLLPVVMMTREDLRDFSLSKVDNPPMTMPFYLVTQSTQKLDEDVEEFVADVTQEARRICDEWRDIG